MTHQQQHRTTTTTTAAAAAAAAAAAGQDQGAAISQKSQPIRAGGSEGNSIVSPTTPVRNKCVFSACSAIVAPAPALLCSVLLTYRSVDVETPIKLRAEAKTTVPYPRSLTKYPNVAVLPCSSVHLLRGIYLLTAPFTGYIAKQRQPAALNGPYWHVYDVI